MDLRSLFLELRSSDSWRTWTWAWTFHSCGLKILRCVQLRCEILAAENEFMLAQLLHELSGWSGDADWSHSSWVEERRWWSWFVMDCGSGADDPWGNLCRQVSCDVSEVLPETIAVVQRASCSCRKWWWCIIKLRYQKWWCEIKFFAVVGHFECSWTFEQFYSPEQALVSCAASAGPVQAVSSDGPGQATRSPCRSVAAVASSSGAESGPAAVASLSGAESGPGQAQPLLLTYLALSRPCALWRRFPGELLRMVLALSRLCGSMQLEWARHCGLGARSVTDLHNPWNLFQHENRGKGWSPAKMACMYTKWRQHPKDKMPWA